MIVDPVQALANVPLPTASIGPVPTVFPTVEYQLVTETGSRTLW